MYNSYTYIILHQVRGQALYHLQQFFLQFLSTLMFICKLYTPISKLNITYRSATGSSEMIQAAQFVNIDTKKAAVYVLSLLHWFSLLTYSVRVSLYAQTGIKHTNVVAVALTVIAVQQLVPFKMVHMRPVISFLRRRGNTLFIQADWCNIKYTVPSYNRYSSSF